MDLDYIKVKIKNGEYDLSEHAHIERQVEQITIKEIEETIFAGEVIERYPKDQRGESMLIAAQFKSRSLHVVCGTRGDRILIVTVYEPKLPIWADYKTRSKPLKDRI